MSSADDDPKLSHLWAIHSEYDHKPAMVGWAPSEAEAKKKMEELRAADPDADQVEYWVAQMTEPEAQTFKEAGVIPKDA